MIDRLLNKTVEVLVAFGTGFPSGGAVPDMYRGVLLEVGDEFCKLSLLKAKSEIKEILIARKFIITIKEI